MHQGVWSLARHALSIGGINFQAGAGEGDSWVKFTMREDWRTVTVGLQGDTVINELADRSVEFELTLSQKSEFNQVLMSLAARTMTRDGDVGLGALLFEDLEGTTEISGDLVITGPPREYTVGGSVQNIVWRGIILSANWKF
jgi:hypothetical protein